MYYHTDRNSNPDSDTLFKELKAAFEEPDREQFANVARNPHGYLE